MTCQEAALQLPWWLNGSLEPAERREVKDHLASCASCREALAETRLAWEIYAQHIPTAALVAYAADEGPDRTDQIDQIDPALLERHLANCPQCAAELEMVRASRLLVDHDEVLVFNSRGERLDERQAAPAQRGRDRGWRAAALAAGLTGLVAIGGWVGTAQQLHRAERAAEPRVLRGAQSPATATDPLIAFNSPLNEIFATVLRDAAAPAPATLQAGSGRATLLLHPRPTDTYRQHAAEVLDAGRKVIATSGNNLELKTGSYYSVEIDTNRVPAGAYTIQVYGTDGGGRKPLDRFPFTIKR
jgi:anti-sigma factor RsiW